MRAILILIATIALVAVIANFNDQSGSAPASESAAPAVDRSPQMQTTREQFLTKMQRQGIFRRYECRRDAADVWVTPYFMTGDFEDKQQLVSVVYAYCFDGSKPFAQVNVMDNKSGKHIGAFSTERGLRMD